MDEFQLGQNIQKLRMEQGLSLRKLSSMAGITPSMLSQIENACVNPSVNTLRSIAQALDVPLFLLFKDAPAESPVIRPENRRIIGSKNEPDVHYEILTADMSGAIEFCIMQIQPGRSSYRDAVSHAGEEVAYMLDGKWAELELDGVTHRMEPGDSVRISPKSPHVWHNPTNTAVKIIFAVTPPTF